jgi:hypothetical protein
MYCLEPITLARNLTFPFGKGSFVNTCSVGLRAFVRCWAGDWRTIQHLGSFNILSDGFYGRTTADTSPFRKAAGTNQSPYTPMEVAL